MKTISSLLFLLVLLLAGCGQGQGQGTDLSGMTGLVSAIEGSRILVIEKVTEEQLKQLDLDEILNKGLGSAIWFEVDDEELLKDLHVGEKVYVEYDIVAESYPGQSKAIQIEKQ